MLQLYATTGAGGGGGGGGRQNVPFLILAVTILAQRNTCPCQHVTSPLLGQI